MISTLIPVREDSEVVKIDLDLPSGKRLHDYGKSPCYEWEDPL